MAGRLKRSVVALLGGAFDPIHSDHLRMAQECVRWGLADEVWLVVAPDVRWDKRTTVPAHHRLEMVRLALAREGQILCCDAEVKAGEYRGTLRLLDRLEKDYPEREFCWMVGSDSYPMIPFWRDPTEGWKPNGEELLRRFSVMVWPRPGSEMPDEEAHRRAGWKPLVIPPQEAWYNSSPTASSEVRRRLVEGESVDEMVPSAVLRYIAEHGLYKK